MIVVLVAATLLLVQGYGDERAVAGIGVLGIVSTYIAAMRAVATQLIPLAGAHLFTDWGYALQRPLQSIKQDLPVSKTLAV
jgi:hypothetical protein